MTKIQHRREEDEEAEFTSREDKDKESVVLSGIVIYLINKIMRYRLNPLKSVMAYSCHSVGGWSFACTGMCHRIDEYWKRVALGTDRHTFSPSFSSFIATFFLLIVP